MITFIIVVLDFCVTGSIIYMLYHDYRLKKSGSTEKPLKKKWQYWLSIFALFCVIGVAASFDNTDTTAQNENSNDTAQSKRKKKRQKVAEKKLLKLLMMTILKTAMVKLTLKKQILTLLCC